MGRGKPGKSGEFPAVLAVVGAAAIALPLLAQTGGQHRVPHRGARYRQQAGRGGENCPTPESWAVAEALASLRPDHRRALVETYYRGRSVAETAATLGVPAETVKLRVFYAMKAFQLALQERGLAP